MADTKVQTQSEQPRGVTRRQEYLPSRDFFSFDPFSVMRRLTEEMERSFASSFGLSRSMGEGGIWSPAIEVREHDNKTEIVAELPGLNKDDVKVEVTNEGILIQGEKRREEEKTQGGYRHSERTYGRFYRQIPLPDGADPDKAQAEFKNGVLHVNVPISDNRRQTKRIQING
jgi:HSP20 family protein